MELIVYANILVSVWLKEGTTRESMFNIDLILYNPEFIMEEFFEHIDKLAKKSWLHMHVHKHKQKCP
jgi:predicted nucleic acid-binding protein